MHKFPRPIRLKDGETSKIAVVNGLTEKIPTLSEVKFGEENTLSRGWQKHWARILLAVAVVILGGAMVVIARAAVSNHAPVATVTTPTIGTSATPATGIIPASTSAHTPTPATGTTPASTSAHTPTPALSIPPTTTSGSVPTPTLSHTSGNTVTVWIQVTDSCEQALSGATFTVRGPGINTTTLPTSGGNPVTIGTTGGCPTQQGNCVAISTGCTTIALNTPSSGTATYEIIVAGTAPGFGTNARYAICQGGSDCPHGPEVATVQISSGGSVSATTLNIYPDGVPVTWPTNKSAYSGAKSDPVLFHEFGIAAQSTTNNQCDGDYDADDYLTGGRGTHCDSDKGNPRS